MKHGRWLLLLAFVTYSRASQEGPSRGSNRTLIQSVGDLTHRIYTERRDAPACVRLLNIDGPVGCSSPQVSAPLQHLDNLDAGLQGPRIILAPAGKANAFLHGLGNDSALRDMVRGVLVGADKPPEDTPEDVFPQAAYAPYTPHTHAWNPNGTGVLELGFEIPVVLLDNVTGPSALSRAAENAAQGFKGKMHYATLDSRMEAEGDSRQCLQEHKCLPLGGHSVWAALPPLLKPGDQSPSDSLPITMVLASMDGNGLFHDNIKGADAPLSGLIAMMAAAEVLGNSSDTTHFSRRLVFTALAGEPWGFMGSKRLLWEMHTGEASTAGLSLSTIDQVLDLRQVGSTNTEDKQQRLFVHSQRTPGFASAETLTQALISAASATDVAVVKEASSSLPGIPPSSLSSFLRANRSIAGAVLADFDKAYVNPYYSSRFDDEVNADAVAAAAIITARALHAIAVNGTGIEPLKVDEGAVKATVAELVACLVSDVPGLQCGLARRLTTVLGAPPRSGYVGILHTLTADSQEPDQAIKSDVSRFIWNFLALRTAAGTAGFPNPAHVTAHVTGADKADKEVGCDPYDHKCEDGALCVGWRSEAKPGPDNGRCTWATARFVPSYPTSLVCDGCEGQKTMWDWRWKLSNASEPWEKAAAWPPDPLWVESNWPEGVPSLRMFLREPDGVGGRTLIGGAFVTLVAALAASAVHYVGRRGAPL